MVAGRVRLATILIAAALFGCKGAQTSAAGVDGSGPTSGAASAVASASPSSSLDGGTRTENVADATLNNMPAFSVTLPAKWKLQGVIMQGGPTTCDSYAFPVWRATSPDGLSYVEQMPQMMWAYGTGPVPKVGCLPINGPMSAQDLLKYVSATLQVKYGASLPAPPPGPQAPGTTSDSAAASVSYQNGSFAMSGKLMTQVSCTTKNFPGFKSILPGMASTPAGAVTKCTAQLAYFTAPASQFDAMMKVWSATDMGFHNNVAWGNAWVKRYAEQGNKQNAAMITAAEAKTAAGNAQIAHTMAVQQQEHDQFLQTMQEGTDRSMANAAAIADSNHTMAMDTVDYSLNQQTVMDPNTGAINKVSSAASYTWLDSSGKTSYQTNDPNANPNGVMQGNWTKQQVVHGDGAQ
jgi:hypothetical protein